MQINSDEAREIELQLKDLTNVSKLKDLNIKARLRKEVAQLRLNFRVGIEVDKGIQFKIFTDVPSISSQQSASQFDSDSSEDLASVPEFSDLKKEITEIVVLWKYIKNLILNLVSDFDVSCRLLKVLSADTVHHHTSRLPKWLQKTVFRWFEPLYQRIC